MKSLLFFFAVASISLSSFGYDLIKDTAPESAASVQARLLLQAQAKAAAASAKAAAAAKTTKGFENASDKVNAAYESKKGSTGGSKVIQK